MASTRKQAKDASVSSIVTPALVKPRGKKRITKKTISKDDGETKVTTTITTIKTTGVMTLENEEDLLALISEEEMKVAEFSDEDKSDENSEKLLQRSRSRSDADSKSKSKKNPSKAKSSASLVAKKPPGHSRSRSRDTPLKKQTLPSAKSSTALKGPSREKKRYKSLENARPVKSTNSLKTPKKSHSRSRSVDVDSQQKAQASKKLTTPSNQKGHRRSKSAQTPDRVVKPKTKTRTRFKTEENAKERKKSAENAKELKKAHKGFRLGSKRADPGKKSENEKKHDNKKTLKSARTEFGLSKRTGKDKKDISRAKSSPKLTQKEQRQLRKASANIQGKNRKVSADRSKSSKFNLNEEEVEAKRKPKKTALFNNDLFNMEDCRDIPYCEDTLHDEIIVDHLNFKKSMALQQAKSAKAFMEQLDHRIDQLKSKIANHDDDMAQQAQILLAFQKEYKSKRHIVEEYERAMEEFEGCREALSELDERAYAFLKSMRKPPAVFHHIIAGVKLMLGKKETEWSDCKHFLLDWESRKLILDFDPTAVNLDCVMAFSNWMKENPDSFVKQRAERVSPIAALLLTWLLSLINITEQVKRFQKMKGEQAGALEEIETLKLNIRRTKRKIKAGDDLLNRWKELMSQCLENHRVTRANFQAANAEVAYYKNQIKQQKFITPGSPV